MKDGMTKDDCVTAIIESVGISLSYSDKIVIANIIEQYTTDLASRIIRSSSDKVSDIISRAIQEVR